MSNLLVSKPVSRRRKNQTHSKTRTVTIEYNITTELVVKVLLCASHFYAGTSVNNTYLMQ